MPLKLTRRAGTGVWQITGTVAGSRIRESTGTTDRKIAEEVRSAREAEIFRGVVYGQASVATFAKAVSSYTDVVQPTAATSAYLARLLRHFGAVKLKDIDQHAVDKACAALCRPDAAAATKVRAIIGPLQAVMNHAARRGWCSAPMFERPPGASGRKRTRWLTPEEYARLRDNAAPHLRPLIVFLACTGARMGEALSLDWRDVDLAHGRAVLREVKAKHGVIRDRVCDVPPAAVAALSTIKGREGRVFRTDHGEPYPVDREEHDWGGQVKRAWAGACRRAGFAGEWKEGESGARWWTPEDVTPHVLRHTWASWHYAVHKDLLRLKQDGDWSSVVLVERYAKLTPDGLVPAIKAAWGMGEAGMRVVA